MKRKTALFLALTMTVLTAMSGCSAAETPPSPTAAPTAAAPTVAPATAAPVTSAPATAAPAATVAAPATATPAASTAQPVAAADGFTYPMENVVLTINSDPLDRSTIPAWVGDDYWWDEYERRTGVRLERVGSAANALDMSDEFMLMLASGEYPDLIQAAWASSFPGGPAAAVGDGYIITLDEYSEHFPGMMEYLRQNPDIDKAIRDDDGNLYCFPKITLEEVGTGPVIRQDWLDQLSLPVPETVEDWYNTLTAFKNDLSVVSPLTFEARWLFLEYAASSLSSPWMVTYPFYVMEEEVVFGPLQPGYRDFLTEMAKWYSEGLIDKDLASVDKNTVQAKFATGESGIAIQQLGNVANCMDANADDPEYEVAPLKAMVLNAGDEPQFSRWVRNFDGGHSVGISTQCEKIEEACRFLDYLFTEEGNTYANYGVEGVSYTEVNGQKQWTDTIMNNPDTPNPGTAKGFLVPSSNYVRVNLVVPPTQPEKVTAIYDGWVCNMKPYVYPTVTHTLEETELVSSTWSEIDTTCREMILKFVLGTEPMTSYDRFVETIKGMGAEDVLAAKAAAYERFINR